MPRFCRKKHKKRGACQLFWTSRNLHYLRHRVLPICTMLPTLTRRLQLTGELCGKMPPLALLTVKICCQERKQMKTMAVSGFCCVKMRNMRGLGIQKGTFKALPFTGFSKHQLFAYPIFANLLFSNADLEIWQANEQFAYFR